MSDEILTPRPVRDSQSEMAEIVLPNDANPLGALLGGRLMHWIDLAGAMAAHRHSRNYVVTASVDHIETHHMLEHQRTRKYRSPYRWLGSGCHLLIVLASAAAVGWVSERRPRGRDVDGIHERDGRSGVGIERDDDTLVSGERGPRVPREQRHELDGHRLRGR